MSVEGAPHKEAKLTGLRTEASGSVPLLLECLCPTCNRPQWHPPANAECIYCGSPMKLRPFAVVVNNVPKQEQPSGDFPGDNQGA